MTVAYCREEETGVGHARQWSEEACEQDTGSERMRQKETNREKREGGEHDVEHPNRETARMDLGCGSVRG